MKAPKQTILQVRNLKKYFPVHGGFFNRPIGHIRAVDSVDFDIYEGECLGIVGESGSGKTTVGRVIMRAYDATEGSVLLREENGNSVDITTASGPLIRHLRRHLQMIFQDPYGSLNPRMTVMDIVSEPLLNYGMKSRKQRQAVTQELLEKVGLDREHMNRYPHAFSGGQRQRIGIARALALNPRLIIADEPVSALDVSVQAQILNLLVDLQKQLNLSYLFITHDLRVVRHICDRVAVMVAGKIVEIADVDNLFKNPAHPYTEVLLASIPVPDPKVASHKNIAVSEASDADTVGARCPFYARCKYKRPECARTLPELVPVRGRNEHRARCLFADELNLKTYL